MACLLRSSHRRSNGVVLINTLENTKKCKTVDFILRAHVIAPTTLVISFTSRAGDTAKQQLVGLGKRSTSETQLNQPLLLLGLLVHCSLHPIQPKLYLRTYTSCLCFAWPGSLRCWMYNAKVSYTNIPRKSENRQSAECTS